MVVCWVPNLDYDGDARITPLSDLGSLPLIITRPITSHRRNQPTSINHQLNHGNQSSSPSPRSTQSPLTTRSRNDETNQRTNQRINMENETTKHATKRNQQTNQHGKRDTKRDTKRDPKTAKNSENGTNPQNDEKQAKMTQKQGNRTKPPK